VKALDRGVKCQDIKDRVAKARDAKDEDAKDEDAKDRDVSVRPGMTASDSVQPVIARAAKQSPA
jgi:hypothetical protein